MTTEQYFWNKKGETFAGCKFGEDVTEYFKDDQPRRQEYIDMGKIVSSKPVDFNDAKQSELNVLRKTVDTQKTRITELEAEAKKGGSNKPSKKVKDLEADLGTANATIKKLEADLEEATKPGKK